ncbi:MAG: universal stress protein [Desulfuromonadales bacterium]|nr:universal stress protein [Desulfuromonadales bacterium]MDT8422627.1 universal stress protein [Desulfuromonadales bacterium]
MRTQILVPVNDSDASQRTVATIIAQKERFPVPLTLLHVVNTEQLAYRMIPDFQLDMVQSRAESAGNALLEKFRRQLADTGISTTARLEIGNPRKIIPRIANDEGFSLLIIGRRHSGEIRDVLFGSVANYVLHNVTCPVLLF